MPSSDAVPFPFGTIAERAARLAAVALRRKLWVIAVHAFVMAAKLFRPEFCDIYIYRCLGRRGNDSLAEQVGQYRSLRTARNEFAGGAIAAIAVAAGDSSPTLERSAPL
ncbi:hypothetical protein GCM10028856_06530 [Halopiger thermotolerans]